MTPRTTNRPRAAAIGLAAGCALLAAGCLPEAVVDVETTVYADGSLDRAVRIAGRTGEREVPTGPDWPRRELAVGLADPDAWSRIDVRDGVLEFGGFFAAAEDVPPLLRHHLDDGVVVRDRGGVRVRIDDLVLLRRWTYVETWGDPFGASSTADAVDELLRLVGRLLREDLRRDLGDGADLAGLDGYLAGPVRQAFLEVLQVERRFAEVRDDDARARALAFVLSRHGVEVPARGEGDFWNDAGPSVLDAFAAGLADALSGPETRRSPDDFAFLRAADGLSTWFDEAERNAFGENGEFMRLATPAFGAIQGGYGGVVRTRFRFRSRAVLPGRLVRTDGTPDAGGSVRFFRGEAMLSRDVVGTSASLEPDVERLRALGARRDFEVAELLQMEELLDRRDPRGVLRGWVERAVAAGSVAPLRDADLLPDEIEPAATELADLLEGTAPGS